MTEKIDPDELVDYVKFGNVPGGSGEEIIPYDPEIMEQIAKNWNSNG